MLLRTRWMLCAPVIALLAQDPAVIRVNTRMVEVNVIVQDNKGPVAGLTKDDFTIFDKGTRQKIAFFSANSIHHSPAAASSPKAPAKTVFTNRPTTGADATQSATVVLLDGLNTQFQDQIYAKKQVVKFLGQIRPDDHIAVYTLGNGLKVLHDFSSDSRSLLNAVAKFNGENLPFVEISEPDPANSSDPDLDTHLNDLLQTMADQSVMNRVRLTSAALISIANHVSHIPGRKTLVWVSSSFPFSLGACGGENPTDWNQTYSGDGSRSGCMQLGPPPVTTTPAGGKRGASNGGAAGLNAQGPSSFMMPSRENLIFDVEIRKAMQALNAANIVIDPVDARGLTSMPKMFLATMPSRAKNSAPPPFQDVSPTGISVMEIVAADTGGRAFYNTNDIQGAIRRAVDDSDVTYTLGFYPDSKALDAKFHPLKVEVAKKGLEVRYRKGYTASQDALLTDGDREQVVKDALWSPLAATGITIAATLAKADKAVRISLIVDPNEIEFNPIDGKRKAEIEIAFEQRSVDGHDLGKTEQVAPITLDEDRYQSRQPLTLTKTLTPAEGLSEVRVAVFDRKSGRIGSLTIPIK